MSSERYPFSLGKNESFFDKLNEWIGDVFYDILPEAGFELRDEQIFMAFQLERAFKEKKVMFAEAGVGTGKTIVYLLYAICYARYIGKPAIIACADETLIEQLVKKEGDIAKISKILGLNIDVRLAKSPDQYLCLNKLDDVLMEDGEEIELYEQIFDELPIFVHDHTPLQSFYHYGDRKDYAHLSDEQWKKIAWDPFQDCLACEKRHRCGQTLSREHYRKATDLIICSHDFYMEHVWTYEARKREGQLPLLPEASCVVFDEGHLLEFAAQKALTYRMKETTLETLLSRLLENDIREELAYLIEETLELSVRFFDELLNHAKAVPGSNRQEITFTDKLLDLAKKMQVKIGQIGDELVFESETYTIDHYQLKIVDEYLDQIDHSLHLFIHNREAITWLESSLEGNTLVIMPRTVQEVLREKVFSKRIPFIFSSATLSNQKSFDYIAKSLGIDEYLSFSVDSPFDYDEQMTIYMPVFSTTQDEFQQKYAYALQKIRETNGRALVLFPTREELLRFKALAEKEEGLTFLFEGDQEISELVSRFQNEEETILCAEHLWEGLDIPGPSLSNVIIWSLPYPPNDPVFQAKRKQSENPFWEVDVPYMILRLRQGVGRLIRQRDDRGIVSIFVTDDEPQKVIEAIKQVLPTEVKEEQ
ncbi:ATP-dependent DNA helicase DinG [Thermolongibacillus altinsuensis]|uniref:ATP-dependent DNA helicase DinG n=1 Tax=Thermolongibacillus altinsuensis TaxID=575256 RepID=A0A4R1QEE2_9BACL|nr:ATP-dependent DNA helicase [Thermolongibacillus altinsuensis]TCL49760.1 ATP-dependent DNA helicase DinG [Thermolongibacillus altinsuensis]GMB08296.1 ATP-dependent helicase [Thermolongibacillus altinsuensis]